jgi:predicted dehydrogenase
MRRRHFLALSIATFACGAENQPPLRAAVIGHTGRGDYGHGLEKIFTGRPGIQLVALADPDESGRAKTAAALGGVKSYADYRELLAKEKPDLVSVGMRHSDQHRDIILACLQAGAHVYSEKPITRTPAEADELLAAATAANRKVAVAHTMRQGLGIRRLRDAIQKENLLGDLSEMRAYGKQDPRAGGEDLMVLGSHLMDLMRLFAGDPQWCTARVLTAGRDITRSDARLVKDNIGLVAGDQIFAQYAFPNGINASFTSTARMRENAGSWGLELLGSKGSARICDVSPNVFVRRPSPWTPTGRTDTWQPFDPATVKAPDERPLESVADWLESITAHREPVCSLRNAAWAVEMVCAVYESALSGQRASFPLKKRTHPLEA